MCARAESGMAIKAAVATLAQAIASTCNDAPPSRLRDSQVANTRVGTARQRSKAQAK